MRGEVLVKPGKLSPADLERLVFPRHGTRRSDVVVRAGIGQDSAVVDLKGQFAVLSTDPITGAGARAGWLAIHIGCNDVAAAGAEPIAALVTLLLAPATAHEDVVSLMEDAHRAASELGVEIVGGHTEITGGLTRSIVVVTALGGCAQDRFTTVNRVRPGDAILMTKWAGLEGTAVLASDLADELRPMVGAPVLLRAQRLLDEISIVPEARVAAANGATAMHDATEGGVVGALAELAAASGVGVDVVADQIPILPETRDVCAALQIDPLQLVSSGVLLIATPDPERVARAVSAIGRPIARVGAVVDGQSVLRRGAETIPLLAPERDALWDALIRFRE
jgi:hydrogenase maturation factor